ERRRDLSRIFPRRDDPDRDRPHPLPRQGFGRPLADAVAAAARRGGARVSASADDRLILALPNGRILGEVMPLLRPAGVEPEPAFDDPGSRQLRFATSDRGLDLIRVRSFDVATFVAFGAAQLGVAGNDVLMEFDYSEVYAPLDLDVGHCHVAVAAVADWAA